MDIMRTVEFKLVDVPANEGGGTKLTVKIDGREVSARAYSQEELTDAKRAATEAIVNSRFDNVPGNARPNV
jgi:hypothetical protein